MMDVAQADRGCADGPVTEAQGRSRSGAEQNASWDAIGGTAFARNIPVGERVLLRNAREVTHPYGRQNALLLIQYFIRVSCKRHGDRAPDIERDLLE